MLGAIRVCVGLGAGMENPLKPSFFFGASQGFFLSNGCVQVIGRFLAVYIGV